MPHLLAILCLVGFSFSQTEAPISHRNEEPKAKENHRPAVREAEAAEKKQDFDQVIAGLKPHSDNLSRKGLFILARAYKAKNLFNEEQKILNLATNHDPKDYVALTLLGFSYSRLKKSGDAAKVFRRAINLKKDYKDAYDGLLMLAREKNNRYDTRMILEEAVMNVGADPDLMNQLCASYAQDAFIEKAISTCADAIRKDPTYPSNHIYLGLAHLDSKDKVTARKILLKAAQQFADSAFAQCAAGEVLRSDDDWVGAAEYFSRGTIAEPSNYQCWIGLADAQLENKDFEKSYASFEKACTLNRQKALPIIKKVSGKFRQEKNTEWREKFQSLANRC